MKTLERPEVKGGLRQDFLKLDVFALKCLYLNALTYEEHLWLTEQQQLISQPSSKITLLQSESKDEDTNPD